MINLFQELSYHLTNGKVTNSKIDEFIEKSREKNIDVGLFDSTERILNNYLDYETIIKLYESENHSIAYTAYKSEQLSTTLGISSVITSIHYSYFFIAI